MASPTESSAPTQSVSVCSMSARCVVRAALTNGADYQRSVMQEIAYYKSVVAKMGQARADAFIRFSVTPGVNHAGEGLMSNGAAVPSDVDLLGALDSWADEGKAPGTLTEVTQDRRDAVQGHSLAADVSLSALPALQRTGRFQSGVELHLCEPMTAGTPGVHEEYPG
jgi:hypothetical protein